MADALKATGKVEIRIGNLSFVAEGDQEWLGEQLNKIMKAAGPAIARQTADSDHTLTGRATSTDGVGSLASFLKTTKGETKQVQRFLATAGWLFRRGETKLTTSAVSSALSTNHQKRLGNPADCLNQNVSKGYCEKQGDGFFVTPEGWKALGQESA
jgi:hypothetical protein